MSAGLPVYSKLAQDDIEAVEATDAAPEGVTTYSFESPALFCHKRHIVTTRYPTKEAAIEGLSHTFPALARFAPENIRFSVPFTEKVLGGPHGTAAVEMTSFAEVDDRFWHQVTRNAERVKVTVKLDKRQRFRRGLKITALAAAPFFIFLIFISLAIFFLGTDS